MSVARATIATKGELNLRARRARIDIQDTRGNIAHSPLNAIDIPRVNGARQTKFAVVVGGDGLFKSSHLDNRERRAKNLFLSQAHLWTHIGKERGAIEVSFG